MAVPLLDVRVNFDQLGLTRLANDGFETDTSGWSVAAGIQAAATSITRTVSAPYMGAAVGRLVTTATNGSGVKFVMSSSFSSGVAYRFRVYLKSISGATTCGIRIGSLGTVGDRAVSTFTVTASWAAYSVDFTPTGNRTDIQVNVYTNSAAIMTVDIDDAEVYAVADDLTSRIDDLNASLGANFEGGPARGTMTLNVKNDDLIYTDGVLPFELQIGRVVYARASYAGIPYGLFYGTVKRVSPNVVDKFVSLFCEDPVAGWATFNSISIASSLTRSISEFRGAILDAIGEPAGRRSLSVMDYEANKPLTGADEADAVSLLASVDQSTESLGYVDYDPSPSVLFQYVTKTDYQMLTQALADTIDDTITGAQLDWLPDDIRTVQRVDYSLRQPDVPGTIWESTEVPISLPAGTSATYWASFADGTTGAVVGYTATGSPSVVMTAFNHSAKIVITAGGSDALVTELSVFGTVQTAVPASATYTTTSTLGTFVGNTVSADFISSTPIAGSLAQRLVERYPGTIPRTSPTVTNIFPTAVARSLGDSISVNVRRVQAAAITGIVNRIDYHVSTAAAQWDTTFGIEPRSTVVTGLFILDTSALNGAALLGT
jgi:hypothetical protein